MSKTESNKNQSLNANGVWVVRACQHPAIFGVFNTLEQAHDAICSESYVSEPLELAKEYMPLDYNEKGGYTNQPFYLVWDESDPDWYMEPPLFCISEHEIGRIYDIIEVKQDKSTDPDDDDE